MRVICHDQSRLSTNMFVRQITKIKHILNSSAEILLINIHLIENYTN